MPRSRNNLLCCEKGTYVTCWQFRATSETVGDLGGTEQVGVNDAGAEGAADWSYLASDSLQEGGAGIRHQVPPIGDLHRLRCRRGDRAGMPPDRSRATTRMPGWEDSQALTVAGSRSGRRSITRRRSRSQMIVP